MIALILLHQSGAPPTTPNPFSNFSQLVGCLLATNQLVGGLQTTNQLVGGLQTANQLVGSEKM